MSKNYMSYNALDYFTVDVVNEPLKRYTTLAIRDLKREGVLSKDKVYTGKVNKKGTHMTIQGEDGFNLEADLILSPYKTFLLLDNVFVNGTETKINNELVYKQVVCLNDLLFMSLTDGCSPWRQKAIIEWSEGVL